MTSLFAYFGHHKCATSWINKIIQRICLDMNLRFSNVHNPEMFDYRLGDFIKANKIDFISYTNADVNYVSNLPDFLGFHVVRDPRDIVVSAYFSHLNSHDTSSWPELETHRTKLKNCSRDEGLFLEMEYRKNEFEALYNWNYMQSNILELKMEKLIKSPLETMVEIFNYLGLIKQTSSLKQNIFFYCSILINNIIRRASFIPDIYIPVSTIPMGRLLEYTYESRFSKMAEGRKQGVEDTKSHYRKGIAGDWINYFNKDHKKYFIENYKDLLEKLGYIDGLKP